MKMNDPFGRMERRREAEYEALLESLRKKAVNSPEEARELIEKSRKRIFKTIAGVVVTAILLSVAFSKEMPLIACLAVLIIVMCLKSLRDGKDYIDRYIEEELSGSNNQKTG